MWSRTTTDPLGRKLFESYGLHILSRPRVHLAVFDVLPFRDGKAALPGGIDAFLRVPFGRPEVLQGEDMLEINGTMSAAISGGIGLDFLKGFLALIGVGVAASVGGAIEASKSDSMRFRFGGCKRDHVKDGFDLDWKLSEVKFDKKKSAMRDDYRYYIATAVHSCTELTFELLDKQEGRINVAAEIDQLGGAKANLEASKDGQITAKSDKKLVYGVELNEIVYDEKRKHLQLLESRNYVQVQAGAQSPLPKAMIGGQKESMLLTVSGEEE